MDRMFIEVAITRTLRIQKKEGTEGKKNTLYIVITQACASPDPSVLKHKEGVDPKGVCDTKERVCHRSMLANRNTKECVCLVGNRSWCRKGLGWIDESGPGASPV